MVTIVTLMGAVPAGATLVRAKAGASEQFYASGRYPLRMAVARSGAPRATDRK